MKSKGKILLSLIAVVFFAVAVTVFSSADTLKHYSKTTDGQTYGSAVDEQKAGGPPDLIMAVGIDGTEGYIKKGDLPPMPKSPEEALKQKADMKAKGSYTIPLYKLDGKTVIGEFPIGGGTTSENGPSIASVVHSN